MIHRPLFVGVFISFFTTFNIFAQKDFAIWSGLEYKVIISKKLSLGGAIQFRSENNNSQLAERFASPYIKYRAFKNLNLGVDYRFSNNWRNGVAVEDRHRVTIDLNVEKLLKSLPFKTRFALSSRIRYVNESRTGDLNNQHLRGRIKLSYNVRKTKIEPYIASELFYHFNDQLYYTNSNVLAINRFNKLSLKFGISLPFTKKHLLRVFYMLQKKTQDPGSIFVTGLNYRFRWKV